MIVYAPMTMPGASAGALSNDVGSTSTCRSASPIMSSTIPSSAPRSHAGACSAASAAKRREPMQ